MSSINRFDTCFTYSNYNAELIFNRMSFYEYNPTMYDAPKYIRNHDECTMEYLRTHSKNVIKSFQIVKK